jgi:autotransporter-associated beta strand protein
MIRTERVAISTMQARFAAALDKRPAARKCSEARRAFGAPRAIPFQLKVLALLLFAGSSQSGFSQVLPTGSLLDLNSSAQYGTANVFQNFSVTFTATTSGNNYVLFAFRQDPAYWTFGNVGLTVLGSSVNLLTDPTFTQGGNVSAQSGLQAPASWGIVYQTGTTPAASGFWAAPGSGGYSTTNVNSGTAGSWYDGAVGSFDGIYQGVDLVGGTSYTISFTALSNNPASTAGGIELGVFAGACLTLTGSDTACVPGNAGFTPLATPGQTANAGSSATNITSVVTASGLAANPQTVLPIFDGGTLTLDGTTLTPYSFTITANNGTIDLAGTSATISNPIADNSAGTPGSLAIINSGHGGALTLSAANTYSGSTTIGTGATLALSGVGSIASSSGLTNNGIFDISGVNSSTSIQSLAGTGSVLLGSKNLTLTNAIGSYSGTIAGAGSLTLQGGIETLTGTNTYLGGTNLYGGTVVVSADANLGAAAGVLNFNGGSLITAQGITSARAMTTSAAGGTINNAGNNNTFTGSISGSGGMTFTGSGITTLDAANAYSGVTSLTAGVLRLGNSGGLAGNLIVEPGAIFLPGSGSIAGSSTNAGVTLLTAGQSARIGGGLTNENMLSGAGTIVGNLSNGSTGTVIAGMPLMSASGKFAPMPGGGTTMVRGNVSMASGGDFIFAVAPTASPTSGPGGYAPNDAHTELDVTGNIHLGGKITVDASPGIYLKTTYVLINDPSPHASITGSFASTLVQGLPRQDGYYMTYNPDPQVLLTIYPKSPFLTSGSTTNEKNVAAVLDSAVKNSTGAFEEGLSSLFAQPAQVRNATLDRIDGELYADMPSVLTQGVRDSWSPVFAHIGLSDNVNADPGQSFWISTTGSVGQLQGDANASGIHENTTDFLFGGQSVWQGWTLGGAIGSSQIAASRDDVGDSASADLWQAGVFAGHDLGDARLGLLAGYSSGHVGFAQSSLQAYLWSGQARVAQTFPVTASDSVTPMATIDTAHLDLEGGHETGPLGVTVPTQSTTMADARLTLRLDHQLTIAGTPWTASAALGALEMFNVPQHTVGLTFNGAPDTPFYVAGVGPDRTLVEFTAGLATHVSDGLAVELGYRGFYGAHTRVNELNGKVNWTF